MNNIIYIADDDNNIRNLLKSFLEREGYVCFAFENGELLLNKFTTEPCDLVILDVMMPGRDGFFILQEIRKFSNVPIIMLTARDSDQDYIQGLNLGSDDYFTKPFSPVKLVTKVKSILKRHQEITGVNDLTPVDDNNLIEFGNLKIYKKTKIVTIDDVEVSLTPNEFSLIAYLILNKDRAVGRPELLEKIWGFESEIETRVADDTVKRLRKKIAVSNVEISTVWGYGFKVVLKKE
ncbi:MAG: response regulator transcription factor [Clostridia bacterium]|nr:response regulator transcription factor [Clostridia bacterium]